MYERALIGRTLGDKKRWGVISKSFFMSKNHMGSTAIEGIGAKDIPLMDLRIKYIIYTFVLQGIIMN